MGKKVRCRKTYVSKGQRDNVSKSVLKMCKNDDILNKALAWKKGKKGFVTIKNPIKSQTNKPFIKVTLEQYFGGNYKAIMARIKPNNEVEG